MSARSGLSVQDDLCTHHIRYHVAETLNRLMGFSIRLTILKSGIYLIAMDSRRVSRRPCFWRQGQGIPVG